VFAEPERTRYDVNFRLFGFPVRIHPWFWLVTLLFGANVLEAGLYQYFLVWVAVLLLSLLVHELGHALAFRRFGVDSHIVLHAFGGLAVPWSAVRGRGRRILVSLAGPVAGFILFGIVYASNYESRWAARSPQLFYLYHSLIFVNLYWGLVNLLPIWPLDGGQVCDEVCTQFWPRKGRQLALQISIVVAGAFCLYSLACILDDKQGNELLERLPTWLPRGSLWSAILFGMLAAQSYQVLQRVKWTESHWDGY
jgi:stage IV sporulation protein FB